MSEAEKADTHAFLKEILQIRPLVNLRAFEKPKTVAMPLVTSNVPSQAKPTYKPDTIVVPAQQEGFDPVFFGEDCWYAIRITEGMLDQITYIAVYQSQPISAITHDAPVSRIEASGEEGKYRLIFSKKAMPIGPIPFADAPPGAMQSPRYTTFDKLQKAKKLSNLLGKG